MQVPPEVTFRNMERSNAVARDIDIHIRKLEEFCDRIISCHVVIEAPHHHHRKGGLYHVRIHIAVPPNRIIAVDRGSHKHTEHQDVHVAIRDAFKAARRQLQDFVGEIRGETKHHEPVPHGRIIRLLDEPRYGFIETPDGGEVYFDFNAVLHDDLEKMTVGSEVRFVEELGDKGLQAVSVQLAGHQHRMELTEL